MQNETNTHGTTLRHPAIRDDYLIVTSQQGDPLRIARYLADELPHVFAWEQGKPTKRYATSLASAAGVYLAYGRRSADDYLNAPQSAARDSTDWKLEVPGEAAHLVRPVLLAHPLAASMQAPARDVQITARFHDADATQIYATFNDLVQITFGRAASHYGPHDAAWEGVTLYTHPLRGPKAPRTLVLYDKHSESPDEYPDRGTLRFEVRLRPDKAHAKRSLLTATPAECFRSWRFSRTVLELLTNSPQIKAPFRWYEPKADDDLETATANLLRSYGPTLLRGLHAAGLDYLHRLALAALLQADPATHTSGSPREPVCPEADYSETGGRPLEAIGAAAAN